MKDHDFFLATRLGESGSNSLISRKPTWKELVRHVLRWLVCSLPDSDSSVGGDSKKSARYDPCRCDRYVSLTFLHISSYQNEDIRDRIGIF
jgi:hypothetical protein